MHTTTTTSDSGKKQKEQVQRNLYDKRVNLNIYTGHEIIKSIEYESTHLSLQVVGNQFFRIW